MCNLSSNKFRVLDIEKFKDFMGRVVIEGFELCEHKIDETYFSFSGTSEIKGILEGTRIVRLNSYSFALKLQEFLIPSDRIVIKIIFEDNAQAYLITKNKIEGIDLNNEILLAFKNMK